MKIGDMVYRKDPVGFESYGFGLVVEVIEEDGWQDIKADLQTLQDLNPYLPMIWIYYHDGLIPEFECDLELFSENR